MMLLAGRHENRKERKLSPWGQTLSYHQAQGDSLGYAASLASTTCFSVADTMLAGALGSAGGIQSPKRAEWAKQ